MQLGRVRPGLGCRHACNGSRPPTGTVLAPAPHRPTRSQPPRDTTAQTTKSTTLTDLEDYVERPNPEKRFMKTIDWRGMMDNAKDWRAVVELEDTLRDRFGQQPSLAASLVIRLGAVLDVETADEAARKGAARLLNTSLAPFIVNKGVYSYKPHITPPLFAALAALQYRNPKLNAALITLWQGGIEHMKSTQVFAAACSATQLGVRLNDEQLKLLAGKAARTLRFATPEDIANLAAVLAPYNRLPAEVDSEWLGRLAATALPMLESMSGEQLVDLLLLFVKQDFPLTSTWLTSFQSALLAALPTMARPRSYASLMFSLAKGSLAITEEFLTAVLQRMLQPPRPAPAARRAAPRGRAAAAAPPPPSLLAAMRPGDLAVVAAVLSIYGYAPDEEWAGEYVTALAEHVAEFDAKQVVTIVDACSELGLELGADLTDELLAVAEGAGLDQLPAGRLAVLAGALGRAGHQPDELWLRAMHKALLTAVARSRTGQDLADAVAVLPTMPHAYTPDSANTAAVLEAVKTTSDSFGGLDATSRTAISKALTRLGHAGARAFVDSLQPAPQAPAPKAPARSSLLLEDMDEDEYEEGEEEEQVVARAPVPAAAAAARRAPAAAPARAAPAAPARPAQQRPAAGRFLAEEEEDEDEDEYEEYEEGEEEEVQRPVARAAAPSSRAAPAARAAAPPPPPPPAVEDDGMAFVSSTRRTRGSRGSR